MPKARILYLSLNAELNSSQIAGLRGAVVEMVGREHQLFHNHIGGNTFRYDYPLVHYKMIKRKPTIMFLGAGVSEINKVFGNQLDYLTINGERVMFDLNELRMVEHDLDMVNPYRRYRIRNWLLNDTNIQQYNSIESFSERIQFLERKLIGQILGFAQGMGWHIEERIKVAILDVDAIRKQHYKVRRTSFNLSFSTNVYLPQYIGLGKGVAQGKGVVTLIRERTTDDARQVSSNQF